MTWVLYKCLYPHLSPGVALILKIIIHEIIVVHSQQSSYFMGHTKRNENAVE